MATYLNGNEISIVTLGNNIEVDKLTTKINKLETELAIYTVKVLVNIDNKITEYYVEKGKTLTLEDPIKEDYIFDGWYLNGTNNIDLNTYIFNTSAVIYARFKENVVVYEGFNFVGDALVQLTSTAETITIPTSYSKQIAGENSLTYSDTSELFWALGDIVAVTDSFTAVGADGTEVGPIPSNTEDQDLLYSIFALQVPITIKWNNYQFIEGNDYQVTTVGITGTNLMEDNNETLVNLYIPEGITTIGNNAIRYCNNLEVLSLPTTLTNLVVAGIHNLPKLKSLHLPSGINEISNIGMSCTSLETLIIEEGPTSISSQSFYGCTALKSVIIPNSVTSISNGCFNQCTALEYIKLSDNLVAIETVLDNCVALKTIEIPAKVTSIIANAFRECTAMTYIIVNAITPPTIGANALPSNIEYIYVPVDSVDSYKAAWTDYADKIVPIGYIPGESIDSIDYSLFTFKANTLTKYTGDASNVIIPSSYSIMSEQEVEQSFDDMYELMDYALINDAFPIEVTDGDGQTYTFNDDMDMHDQLSWASAPFKIIVKEYTFGEGDDYQVTAIGIEAFKGCINLTNIVIPDTITNIGMTAFAGTSLTNVNLPSTITEIQDSAFQACNGLFEVDLTNCTSLTRIGAQAFALCKNLTTIKLPSSLTIIDFAAFWQCTSLTNINLDNCTQLTTLRAIFNDCTNLTNITVPRSITTIENSAFSRCTGLSIVYVQPTVPPTLGTNAFLTNVTAIYVPHGCKDVYKAADNWSNYSNLFVEIESEAGSYDDGDDDYGGEILLPDEDI